MNSDQIPGEIRLTLLTVAMCLVGSELIQFFFDLGLDDLTDDFFLSGLAVLAATIAISVRIPFVSRAQRSAHISTRAMVDLAIVALSEPRRRPD